MYFIKNLPPNSKILSEKKQIESTTSATFCCVTATSKFLIGATVVRDVPFFFVTGVATHAEESKNPLSPLSGDAIVVKCKPLGIETVYVSKRVYQKNIFFGIPFGQDCQPPATNTKCSTERPSSSQEAPSVRTCGESRQYVRFRANSALELDRRVGFARVRNVEPNCCTPGTGTSYDVLSLPSSTAASDVMRTCMYTRLAFLAVSYTSYKAVNYCRMEMSTAIAWRSYAE